MGGGRTLDLALEFFSARDRPDKALPRTMPARMVRGSSGVYFPPSPVQTISFTTSFFGISLSW